jgi:hypothetical protein
LEMVKTEILSTNSQALVRLAGSAPARSAPELDGEELLEELARRIKELHSASLCIAVDARSAARLAIEYAVLCGGYLRQAKAKLPHGEFLSWAARENGHRTAHGLQLHAAASLGRPAPRDNSSQQTAQTTAILYFGGYFAGGRHQETAQR